MVPRCEMGDGSGATGALVGGPGRGGTGSGGVGKGGALVGGGEGDGGFVGGGGAGILVAIDCASTTADSATGELSSGERPAFDSAGARFSLLHPPAPADIRAAAATSAQNFGKIMFQSESEQRQAQRHDRLIQI